MRRSAKSIEEKRLILKQLVSSLVLYICDRYKVSSLITQWIVNWLVGGIDRLVEEEVDFIFEQIHRFVASNKGS
ncbi:MAG: hypothetical protein QXQ20_08735 [Candidatus Nezhaarchaeales archaeon]